jgi:hypothetical protein
MEIFRYNPDWKEEWDRFNHEAINGTLLFNRGFMDYHADRFPDHSLVVMDEGKWLAIIPGTSAGKHWVSHSGLSYGGLVYQEQASQRKVCEFLRLAVGYLTDDGICKILIKTVPDIYWKSPHKAQDYALFQAGFELVRRDAATTITLANRGKISKGRKASIARAKREGVTVEASTNFAEFIDLENANLMEKYGTVAVHSASELELLHSRFPESIRLFVARKDGSMIAGGLVFQSCHVCHLQYFGTNPIGDEFGGGDLVIETMISDCQVRDIRVFDFGISTEDQGKTINDGLMRYKESFGGTTTIADFYQLER